MFEKLVKWIKEHALETTYIAIVLFALIFIVPLIINFSFGVDKGIPVKWETKDALLFYGSVLSFLGTVILGGLALYQNNRFKDENDKSQANLNNTVDKLAEANKKANDISNQLLRIEKDRYRPFLVLAIEPMFYISKENFGFSSSVDTLLKKTDLRFDTNVINQSEADFFPDSIAIFMSLKNIGMSPIYSVSMKSVIFNNPLGKGLSITQSNNDIVITPKERKRLSLVANQSVLVQQNKDQCTVKNLNQQYFEKLFNLPIAPFSLGFVLNYTDIYGRDYTQEYSIHIMWKKKSENENEYIIDVINSTIVNTVLEEDK